MKEFEHQLFTQANKLTPSAFSIPLQEKLEIFEKLLGKLDDTIEEDREELSYQLQELDQEIYQDMLEEYEDLLTNNEMEEEMTDTQSVPKEVVEDQDSTSEPTDEAILDELYKMKRTENLGRSLLKDLGVKSDLSRWNILLGKYELQRTAVFRFTYRLKKLR